MANVYSETKNVPLNPEATVIEDSKKKERTERQAPLINSLQLAGYAVGTIADICRVEQNRQEAVSILLKAFPFECTKNRVSIARVLVVPEARAFWQTIVKYYRYEKESDGKQSRVKEALAASMCELADDDVVADVVSLAEDSSQGTSRALLFPFLAKTSSSVALQSLTRLSEDPVLGHAAKLVSKATKMHRVRSL